MSGLSTAIILAALVLLPLGSAVYASAAPRAVERARQAGDNQSMVEVRRLLIVRAVWMTCGAIVFATIVSALVVALG